MRAVATVAPERSTVIAAIGWPNDAASGPIQSLIGLSDALAAEFRFKALVRAEPYGRRRLSTKPAGWTSQGALDLYWCRMSPFGPRRYASLFRSTPHDVVLLNGFFDPEFTIPALVLRRLGLIPRRPTVLSTRGEFSRGALSLKSGRKRAYLALARRLGLHRDVWLHATGAGEAEDIKRVYPFSRGVLVAPNVRILQPLPARPADKAPDAPLRLAFLGRIARVKNLDVALQVLGKVTSRIAFDLFGPVGEAGYWQECQRIIAMLPSNICVTHKGEIANAAVPATLAGYDLLFLPTKGENFGHAIFDALEVGLPVLISDQTPFRDLERSGAGWSLPLDELGRFAEAIESVATMREDERTRMRAAARRLAERKIEESDAVARNRDMLATVLAEAAR